MLLGGAGVHAVCGQGQRAGVATVTTITTAIQLLFQEMCLK